MSGVEQMVSVGANRQAGPMLEASTQSSGGGVVVAPMAPGGSTTAITQNIIIPSAIQPENPDAVLQGIMRAQGV